MVPPQTCLQKCSHGRPCYPRQRLRLAAQTPSWGIAIIANRVQPLSPCLTAPERSQLVILRPPEGNAYVSRAPVYIPPNPNPQHSNPATTAAHITIYSILKAITGRTNRGPEGLRLCLSSQITGYWLIFLI